MRELLILCLDMMTAVFSWLELEERGREVVVDNRRDTGKQDRPGEQRDRDEGKKKQDRRQEMKDARERMDQDTTAACDDT